MRWALPIVLALAACNGRFGLDPVGSEPDDVDNDGIAYDNCREVANPDQADEDSDDLGDACDPCPLADSQLFVDADRDKVDDGCDPCPLGRQHDEDGDGLFDACDNCPIVANADQVNLDADGVGDACEVNEAPDNARTFFDAFSPADPRWVPTSEAWTQDADFVVTPEPGPQANALPTLFRSPDFVAAGGTWLIDVGVELVTDPSTIRVVLDASGSGRVRECELTCSDGKCTVGIGKLTTGAGFAASGKLRIQLTQRFNRLSGGTLVCSVAGMPADTEASVSRPDEHFGLSFGSSDTARIHHLYVQH